jgi:hypothetical protein
MNMPCLDQQPAPSPTWTADKVRARLVEAFDIDRRLPGDRRAKFKTSSWPATPLHDYRDQLHWNNPGDSARDRNWERWANARDVAPDEMTRWQETLNWLRWVPNHERESLEAWAKAEVIGIPLRRMLRYRRWTVTTFYQRRNDGAQRIADKLNALNPPPRPEPSVPFRKG